MNIKSLLAIPFAKSAIKKVYKWADKPIKTQEKVLQYLISEAKNTAFGKDHDFANIKTYDDFKYIKGEINGYSFTASNLTIIRC